jgi:hypothetical protein
MAIEFLDDAQAKTAGGMEWVDEPAAGVEFLDEGQPASVEAIKQRVKDKSYLPTFAEWQAFDRAQGERGVVDRVGDFLNTAGDAAGGLWDMAVSAIKQVPAVIKDPETNNPLVTAAEGVARGVKNDAALVGDIASRFNLDAHREEVDSSRKFVVEKYRQWRVDNGIQPVLGGKLPEPPPAEIETWKQEWAKDVLPQLKYSRFLLKRVNSNVRHAQPQGNVSVMTGEPAPFNPAIADAQSVVTSPAMLVPFGKAMTPVQGLMRRAVGAGIEGAGKAATVAGDATVQAATLPERGAGALARAVSGTEEAAAKATETVAQGVAGISMAPVKAVGKTIGAAGEATEAVGRQLAEPPSRFGLFDRISKDGAAPQWLRRSANMLKVTDPAVDVLEVATRGAAQGAAIGTALGAVAGGEEGAAEGFGSGGALGASGATLGRFAGNSKYRSALEDADRARWLASKSPEEVAAIQGLKLNGQQALALADLERMARGVVQPGQAGDVDFRYVSDGEFQKMFGGSDRGAQVIQGDRPVVFVNTGYTGPRTVFHETMHALDALDGFGPNRDAANRILFDQTLPDGTVVSRGVYDAAALDTFTDQYRSRLSASARSKFDLLSPEEQRARIQSEVRAESFSNLLASGQTVFGARSMRTRVADSLLTADQFSTLGRMRRGLEAMGVKFSSGGEPSQLFVRNGRPITNTPGVDAALRDYIRAKDKITRKLTLGDADEAPTLVVRPQDLVSKGNAGLVDVFKDNDIFARNPDGSVKMMGGVPVLLTEREIGRVQANRVQAMLDTLDRVPATGAAGEVLKLDNGAYEGRQFTPAQLDALLKLSDDLLSPGMKEKLRSLNDLAGQDGAQIILDYNAALRSGRYSSGIAPTTRAVVPLTFNISKAGNFYMATLDTTHFFRKLGEWQRSKPGAFAAWNGDAEAFLRDTFKYLDNHVNNRPGSVGLDADAAKAVHKRNVINDFFNVPKGKGNEHLNPVQVSSKGRKDNLIRSRRFDRINRITPGAGDRFPIRYGLQKQNFMPATGDISRMEPAPLAAAAPAGTSTGQPLPARTAATAPTAPNLAGAAEPSAKAGVPKSVGDTFKANVSPQAVTKHLLDTAVHTVANRIDGPPNLTRWVADQFVREVAGRVPANVSRTAEAQTVARMAQSATPMELQNVLDILLSQGQAAAKLRLKQMAINRSLTEAKP